MEIINLLYLVIAILFLTSLFGLLYTRDVVKIVLGVSILETAVNLFLVATAFHNGGNIPIVASGVRDFVDPLPHAMVLTSIVIGFGVLGLALVLAVKYAKSYGTTDINALLKERDIIDE